MTARACKMCGGTRELRGVRRGDSIWRVCGTCTQRIQIADELKQKDAAQRLARLRAKLKRRAGRRRQRRGARAG